MAAEAQLQTPQTQRTHTRVQQLRCCRCLSTSHPPSSALGATIQPLTAPEEQNGTVCPTTRTSMSAQPGEELGSEGRWFGDDRERNGLLGNTAPRFGEEFKPSGGDASADLDHQQFHPFQADGKRPPVAMETASTGKTCSYSARPKYSGL
ncbi:hypothetical protein GOODEAATRI_008680 [Goodea atripinnis]|uniref:Uncharacterized protein n=1 Tax=Goodea atripinnis TaxID=208336 RepID=A0ABV0PWF4_9TELE